MAYKIYQSDLVLKNHQQFLNETKLAYFYLKNKYNTSDTTGLYKKYNLFAITSNSLLFYKLFKELNSYIRDYIGDNRPLWMKSWLNYHNTPQDLDNSLGESAGFHGHLATYHGYISIDPQNTITRFRNGLDIQNKIGQIYIGPGTNTLTTNVESGWDHFVDLISPSLSPRITIAFDVVEVPNVLGDDIDFPLL